jgi:hypothetical protein
VVGDQWLVGSGWWLVIEANVDCRASSIHPGAIEQRPPSTDHRPLITDHRPLTTAH